MVQQPTQIRDDNPPPTKKGRQADKYEGMRHVNTNSCTTTSSKTQHDIAKITKRLQDYASGTNASNFAIFESIPSLLFGVVETHFQTDLGATTLAIRTILKYCTGCAAEKNASPTSCHRHGILQDLFHKTLVSGGTDLALQAIQQLGVTYWKTAKYPRANQQTVQAQHETMLGCWKIVLAGIELGLSGNFYMHIVQACLAEIEKVKPMDEKDLASHSEIFSSILLALTKALSNEGLLAEHLAPQRPAILINCLTVLSKACMCGKSPQEAATSDDSRKSNDQEHDGNAIPLIEDALEILVVCAHKGLLFPSDFQYLVQACTACLSRYMLSSNGNEAIDRSIPMKVVQLIEIEDVTMGRWLRETYALPSSACIDSSNSLQDSILARYHEPNAMLSNSCTASSLPPDDNLDPSSPTTNLSPQHLNDTESEKVAYSDGDEKYDE